MMTPSQPYMTPAGGGRYATPAQSAHKTPGQVMGPPQTPRGGAWGSQSQAAPGRQQAVPPSPSNSSRHHQQPQQQQQRGAAAAQQPGQDWAKMAQIWAKRKEIEQRRPSAHHGHSPAVGRSPYAGIRESPASPTGDATPLIDER
jgi:hypothetical protein